MMNIRNDEYPIMVISCIRLLNIIGVIYGSISSSTNYSIISSIKVISQLL